MPLNLETIRGPYLDDLLQQPQALMDTGSRLRQNDVLKAIAQQCEKSRFERVVLTGMGGSFFALHPLSIEMSEHGWTPLMLETSELVHHYAHLITPSTLLVVVSQ